ncbi:MAG: response regulator, partial [Candidatus Margulisiibacteriota bacterium]
MAKHILIIDDQKSMRSILTQMLKDKGYQVTAAGDGEEGLRRFNQDPGSFNLILADINMPKIDGFGFLKIVKLQHPKIPVVFLTGINEDVAKIVGKEHKVDGIIKKPFQVEETLAIIEKLL